MNFKIFTYLMDKSIYLQQYYQSNKTFILARRKIYYELQKQNKCGTEQNANHVSHGLSVQQRYYYKNKELIQLRNRLKNNNLSKKEIFEIEKQIELILKNKNKVE